MTSRTIGRPGSSLSAGSSFSNLRQDLADMRRHQRRQKAFDEFNVAPRNPSEARVLYVCANQRTVDAMTRRGLWAVLPGADLRDEWVWTVSIVEPIIDKEALQWLLEGVFPRMSGQQS